MQNASKYQSQLQHYIVQYPLPQSMFRKITEHCVTSHKGRQVANITIPSQYFVPETVISQWQQWHLIQYLHVQVGIIEIAQSTVLGQIGYILRLVGGKCLQSFGVYVCTVFAVRKRILSIKVYFFFFFYSLANLPEQNVSGTRNILLERHKTRALLQQDRKILLYLHTFVRQRNIIFIVITF